VLEKTKPNFYLSGMSAVMSKMGNDYLTPAGPLEIIAGGGLNNSDIEQALSLSVRDAHMASLFEMVPDFVPRLWWESPDWQPRLAKDSLALLEGKVVIK
jgi:hypothetical protein